MSRQRLILEKLIDARLGHISEWAVKGLVRCPPGSLPLWSLQGAECGGSAANMRLYELKAPEGLGCGIPIEKVKLDYYLDESAHHLICYRLAIEPELIEEFIDMAECRLRKDRVAAYGYLIEEYEDTTGGPSGKAVRLVKEHRSPLPQSDLFSRMV